MGIGVGRLIDRRGPRPVLLLGALCMAASTMVFGLTRSPWHTYPAFFLLGTSFACLHTVTLGKIVSRWFVRQRARAMAAATFGASLGGMVLVPLNAALLEHWGSVVGGASLAVIAIVVLVPLALWVIQDGPETLGLLPDGDTAPATGAATDAESHGDYPWTIPQAMRTPAFWLLASSFPLGMIAQAGFLVHQVLFLQTTFGLVGAASIVTVTTAAGTFGRVGFACLGNRWRPRHIAAATFLLQAVSMLLLAVGKTAWLLILGSAIFGFTMGIIVILQPLTAAECFGERTFGRIYGAIYCAIRLGAALGPLVFGLMATAMGTYQMVFYLVAVGLLLAAVIIYWAVPPCVPRLATPADIAAR
jgi:MFS family permease